MPDKFDPYREALVVETSTLWSTAYKELTPSERARIEDALHADPASCEELEYLRMHTGFCRQVNVTEVDVERIRGQLAAKA